MVAVILNSLYPAPDLSASSNARLIAEHGRVPVIELPFLQEATADFAADALAPSLPALQDTMRRDWERVVGRYVGEKQKK